MNWLKEIEEAESADAVVGLLNEYRAHLSPEMWSWVPRHARPPRMKAAEQVHHWHRKLVRELSEATNPNIRFQDVCVLFVRASARLHALEQGVATGASNDGHFHVRAGPTAL